MPALVILQNIFGTEYAFRKHRLIRFQSILYDSNTSYILH